MKEEKKHLYRIDPMKVHQKIYSLYPANSTARKMMAKEEKLREYSVLSKTVKSMPVQAAEELAESSKINMKYGILKGSLFAFASIGLFVSSFFVTTTLELGLVLFLGVTTFLTSLAHFLDVVKIIYSIRIFKASVDGLQERINKLQKDIFE